MKRKLLIVDDDMVVRKVVRNMMESAGFLVQDAVDGPNGLTQAEAFHPDVILLDLMMPGIDGYEVCRRLKANPLTKTIPVVFLTTSPDLSLNRLAYEAGALACVTKPFRRESLIASLEVVLDQAARGVTGEMKPDPPKR